MKFSINRAELIVKLAKQLSELKTEEAYPIFLQYCTEYNLTEREKFRIVFGASKVKYVEAKKENNDKTKKPKISEKALNDARKILGKKPYNESTNYLVGDGYFSRDCITKYGEKVWQDALNFVRDE